jgi:hypothetical protein
MAMASGITAEAGSGRMASSVGAIHTRAAAELPISAPSATPKAEASPQPSSMRPTVAPVKASSSPPAPRPSTRLSSVASGEGRNTRLIQPPWLAAHHRAMSASSTPMEPAAPSQSKRRFMRRPPRPCAGPPCAAARVLRR